MSGGGRHWARTREEAFGYVEPEPPDPDAIPPERTVRFWLSRIGGIVMLVGAGIMVSGTMRGADTDGGTMLFAAGAAISGVATCWAAAMFAPSIQKPPSSAAAPIGSVVVRGRLGVQFLVLVLVLAMFTVGALSNLGLALAEDRDSTTLGLALVCCGFTLVMYGFLGNFVLSMLRFRATPIWWVGERGIGVGGDRACVKRWTDIRRISHHAERNRLLVTYAHRWTIELADESAVIVEYPAEARPGSWRVKRAIRRFAPGVDLQ